MLTPHVCALVRITLLLVFALSVEGRKPRTSFKVTAELNPNFKPNGIAAYNQALHKYGVNQTRIPMGAETNSSMKLYEIVGGRLNARANGRVTANPTQNEAQYLSTVSFGGQQLVVQFDSGSSDTWVFNERLPAASRQSHIIYNSTLSSSFKSLQGYSFNISYGDGSSTGGPVGTESVNIGGISIAGQALGVPDHVSDSFISDTDLSGLIGIAFSRLNTVVPVRQNSLFDNILPILSEPVITAFLPDGQAGLYEFGKITHTAFEGDLNRVAVNVNSGYWEIVSPSAAVNGNNITNSRSRAIIDTGSSIMLVFDSLVTAYYSQVPGAYFESQVDGYIFLCTSVMPDLEIALGSAYVAVIEGEFINYAFVGVDGQGNRYCYGGLQSNQGLPFAIYGDVFFKSQFVVFDGSGPSIGFAPHA